MQLLDMLASQDLQNTERYIKCKLGHVTSPNLLGDVMSSMSRHLPSFKSFWRVQLKMAFYKTHTRGQILWKSVFIIFIIGSDAGTMKKSLTTRESMDIELIFRKKNQFSRLKACVKRNSSQSTQLLKNGQNRDFEPRFQCN